MRKAEESLWTLFIFSSPLPSLDKCSPCVSLFLFIFTAGIEAPINLHGFPDTLWVTYYAFPLQFGPSLKTLSDLSKKVYTSCPFSVISRLSSRYNTHGHEVRYAEMCVLSSHCSSKSLFCPWAGKMLSGPLQVKAFKFHNPSVNSGLKLCHIKNEAPFLPVYTSSSVCTEGKILRRLGVHRICCIFSSRVCTYWFPWSNSSCQIPRPWGKWQKVSIGRAEG